MAMTISFLIWHAVIPAFGALILWIVGMLILRSVNFTRGVQKDRHKRKLSDHPDLLSRQIEYHNKATYRALEFYLKVLFAVLGGVAYIVLFKSPLEKSGCLFIDAAGWIVVLVSGLFCAMVFVHQKSKIERWLFGYRVWSPLFWNETWFFVVGVIIMCSMRGFVGLLLNLPSGK